MANGDAENIPQSVSKPAPALNVQAHLGRASTFPNGKTRDWSLFFFFRILPQAEIDRDFDRLKKIMTAVKAGETDLADEEGQKLLAALHNPSTVNAGILDQEKYDKKEAADAPAQLFLDWLKVITGVRSSALADTLRDRLVDAGIPAAVFEPNQPGSSNPVPTGPGSAATVADPASPDGTIVREAMPLSSTSSRRIFSDRKVAVQTLMSLWQELRPMPAMLADPSKFAAYLQTFGKTGPEAGLKALQGGLRTIVFYELLRQAAPAQWKSDAKMAQHSVMRSEEEEQLSESGRSNEPAWDPTPINVAFTHSGLQALKLDEVVLRSFPEVFKEGMAARAERLGDTGLSAPEHWEGVLGLDRVHGYFTGGFQVGSDKMSVPEKLWQTLREQVRAYNDRSNDNGQALRAELRIYFKLLGLDILHIELGQDPYEVDGNMNVKRLPYRMEHFGFRDGISQPFVDLKLGAPPLGGGTPRRNRTWSPVAAGEIFLDQPDEDGNNHRLPANELLRRGSTFLVFRKLEQDVAGFRAFLSKQRPKKKDQRKLAAQFVGRWQNGTPLVLAPDAPLDFGDDRDEVINDFLYAADDPMGAKCPLGAHVRRTNPRDIGATNDVRRHRILRRGIAYGGPLLGDKVLGDGNKRGLLFVAANSRIDLQFEVIQSNWINKGELLGQAGLNRCPLTGANQGGGDDAFLEAGAVASVTGLPRFVITRGGDYFFVPGVEPLKAIADGCKFKAEPLPYLGYSMAGTATPKLFREDRIKRYAEQILSRQAPSVVRVKLPAPGVEGVSPVAPVKSASVAGGVPPAASRKSVPVPMIAFVGQLEDVREVLSMGVGPRGSARPKIVFSVDQYRAAVHRFSFGHDMLVSTELGSASESTRDRMKTILTEAWNALGADVYARLDGMTKDSIEAALQATSKSGRIDLVHDLASTAVYNVLVKLYGTPGPDYLTELAVALPFSHQHVGKLQPDWLSAAQGGTPDNVGLVTLQIWSILIFLDIVGNYEQQPELMALCGQAASELLAHLGTLIEKARMRREEASKNLLAAFVHLEPKLVKQFKYGPADYYTDVRMLLLELVGTTMANIPAAMGSVMDAVLKFNIPLTELIPVLTEPPAFLPSGQPAPKPDEGIYRLIYETARLNAFIKVLMRTCMQDKTLPSGGKVKKGDVVAALLGVAAFDPISFPEPRRLSLWPYLPGPQRNLNDYLLFGAIATNQKESRDCWGREKLALKILKECIKAAGRLQHLQRVAGPTGKAKTLVNIVIGLSARFAGVLPDRQ